jgi:hypothetical protein
MGKQNCGSVGCGQATVIIKKLRLRCLEKGLFCSEEKILLSPCPERGELLNLVLKNIPFYTQFTHLATSKDGSKRDIPFNNKDIKILQIIPPKI